MMTQEQTSGILTGSECSTLHYELTDLKDTICAQLLPKNRYMYGCS